MFREGDNVWFKKDNSFISNVISFTTKSDFVHVEVIYFITKNIIYTIGAVNEGVKIGTYKKSEFKDKVKKGIYKVKRSIYPLSKYFFYIVQYYLNRKYDWFSAGLNFLWYVFKWKLKSKRPKEMTCSELQARLMYDSTDKKIDMEKELNIPYDYISPAESLKSKYFKEVK